MDFVDAEAPCFAFKQMNAFRCDGIFCDVVLMTEDGQEIDAHKLVLSASSEYFRAMFLTDMKESQQKFITIRAIDSQSMTTLVEFAYTSNVRINSENVETLLYAASMLQFVRVEKACYEFLRKNINVPNCLTIWNLAELHGCAELTALAESYSRGNFVSLLKHSEFKELSSKQLGSLLSHDKLNVPSESAVFEAVMSWIKHDVESRKKDLANLLEHIRFPLLTRKFLIDTVAKEDLIMNERPCREFVLEAIDYHLIPERRACTRTTRTIPREKSSRAVYVVGGEEQGTVLSTAECFDFNKKAWGTLAPMIIARKQVGAAVLEGQLYAVGGVNREYADLVTVECYSPSTSQWTSVASLNKCKGALAVAILEGWLYAAGGSHNGSALKTVERFDPIRNDWTQVASMRLPRSQFGLAALQGRLYAVGGYNGISEIEHVECFDPMNNKWSDVNGMNKARMNHGIVTYGDRIYVIGGANSVGPLDSIEKYNPDLNLWLIIRNTMDPRTGVCVVAVYGGSDGVQDLYIIANGSLYVCLTLMQALHWGTESLINIKGYVV
ncbi:predicted protein [Nematostella vectensis]|uniref:BTB domain-containing protein n=1 Tax=Nematostella vectensis TaxID=45351 RepID=A7RGT6_NEMVE|nr:predicted protein [Nematostella vectensis]|eukprot:XP_001641173.1 predicted protein [Nematostella vectensis]